jgi:hypothetical protein
MFKKILLLIIISVFTITSSYANNEVSQIAKSWFTKFSAKTTKGYSYDKKIKYFEAFSSKLNILLLNKKFTNIQKDLINDLIILSNEYVFKETKFNIEKIHKIKLKTNSLLR